MEIVPGNASHQGKRTEQQDSLGFTRFDDRSLIAHGGVVAIIADGMGGFEGGADAGRNAVDAMRLGYEGKPPWESVPEALLRSLGRANRAVCELAGAIGSEGYCGTTLAAAAIHQDQLYWITVGDSRLYLLRAGRLACLSEDHTKKLELEEQVREGLITTEEMHQDPERESLVSWLGMEALPRICRNETGARLQDGDRLLLCTDGLYRSLSEDRIAALLLQEPQDAAQRLIQTTIDQNVPTQDNVTVIVLGIVDRE
ncbi:MAG: protein phosphatase 2C domain-containing protein [Candidatus Thiosymbion ectosymbiont of Robbea hypermnestra]|nr:protein phosphatase 2C domain-containing protein [Candidatus Thiosymbion ectosymbiont of Robbea hypermnestra]